MHGAEAAPVLGLLGLPCPQSTESLGWERGVFYGFSVSLKDLQGLARHSQTLDEDMDPWSNFLPKGSLQGSGNPPH